MNRNILKIIAILSMLIDHIGAVFFEELLIFRIIGRIAFPIFAFFIAEGWQFTKSRKKYVVLIAIFAVASQVPYMFLFEKIILNVLFTFLLSLLLIYQYDAIAKNSENREIYAINFVLTNIVILCFSVFNLFDYGYMGVILPLTIYIFRNNKNKKMLAMAFLLIFLSLSIVFNDVSNFYYYMQFFSLFALLPLYFYNGKKGKINLKYFFYFFYLVHILVLLIFKLLI